MTKIRILLMVGTLTALCMNGFKSVDTRSAILYNQQGNFPKAIECAKRALGNDPKDAEAHFQLAFAYSNLDSVALAYDHFMTAKKLDPKRTKDVDNNIMSNFAKHYKLGQTSFNRQDVTTAAKEFEMATQSDPSQAVAHYNLAVAYARLAMADSTYHEKALGSADKALSLLTPKDTNYTKALQLIGRELVTLGRVDEAGTRFNRLIEEDPSKYTLIEEIGNGELASKNYKSAVVFLKMAAEARAKVGADDAKLYYNIGVAQYNLRKEDPAMIDEAIASYIKALDITADDPDTVYNVLVAYVAKEDWGNATQWGEKYVSVNPSDARGWQLLARSYTELGDEDKASEAIKRYEILKGGGGQ